MNDDNRLELMKAALARVLPGIAVCVIGTGLMIGLAMLLLTELPGYARYMLSGFPQPYRSISLLLILGGPLVVLCVCGKRMMGYILTHVSNRGQTDEA